MKNLRKVIPYIFLIFGLLMFFYPILMDTQAMPGSLGDARLINYFLEHGYLWTRQAELHTSFWDMPFFYPFDNTLAFSDILLGGMIIYTPIRFFVDSPQTAMQIWLVVLNILNYVSFYLLARKIFKFGRWQSSISAFLFAFGLPRHTQLGHLQLLTQFYMIFSILAFANVKKSNSNLKNHLLFLTGYGLFVLQLYTSFYFGWFMVFGGTIALLIMLCFKSSRDKVIYVTKTYLKYILMYGFLSLGLLIPLVSHYLAVGSQFPWESEFLLRFCSFLYSESLLDKQIWNTRLIWENPFKLSKEAYTGIGFITTFFIFLGILKNKYRIQMLLFISIVVYFFWDILANKYLYHYFPGASAIRAGGRCIFLLLPVFCYGLGFLLQNIKSRILLILIIILCTFEQIPYKTGFNWTKSEHHARLAIYKFPAECKVIHFDMKHKGCFRNNMELDIMWKAMEETIYTANGYTGYHPRYINGSVPDNCNFVILDKNKKGDKYARRTAKHNRKKQQN